jgi:thiamine transport system permease protein
VRPSSPNLPLIGGIAALAAITLLIGGSLAALLLAATDIDVRAVLADSYIRHVVGFTIWQAALSTLLSVGFGIPVARALSRHPDFPGRNLLRTVFVLPFLTPVIVAIFGVVAIYGLGGWFNRGLALLDLPHGFYLYGLKGILIAHVFFNMPLVVTLLLPRFESVPADSWRLAAQLGMGSWAIFRVIEVPLLRQALPNAALLVFLLCFVSFAVVLALGGGPAATTLEVAIYQALRFDFDLNRAVSLALLQLAIGAILVGASRALEQRMQVMPKLRSTVPRPDANGLIGRAVDIVILTVACLFVVLPLLTVMLEGMTGPLQKMLASEVLQRSMIRSVIIALLAGLLCLGLALAVSVADRQRPRRQGGRWTTVLQAAGIGGLIISPLALGTGLFLLFRPVVDQPWIAYSLVIAMNALMALPFALPALSRAVFDAAQDNDRLCAAFGVSGWNRVRLIDWPQLRKPIGLCLALATSLALGDLSAIALFGREGMETLPLLLYQQMGAYRMEQANATAVLLLLLSFMAFGLITGMTGGHARR